MACTTFGSTWLAPKYRCSVLGVPVATRLEGLVRQRADERGWEIIALKVVPDRVHLFVKHDPKSSASLVVLADIGKKDEGEQV